MDTFTKEERRRIMQRVRSKNTGPERKVRSLLHNLGYRFTLHGQQLPGSPDIVLPKYRTVIFVHGCFWHRHQNCRRATTPSSRIEYWLSKFERTVTRDNAAYRNLKKMGWCVVKVWECELNDSDKLSKKLTKILQKNVDK